MTPDPALVRARLDAVTAAMRRCGIWDAARPDDAAFVDMGAFGMNTMTFSQWLRWVFVPRVEQSLEVNGPWPRSSAVAEQAWREADTDPQIEPVIEPLRAFDALFG